MDLAWTPRTFYATQWALALLSAVALARIAVPEAPSVRLLADAVRALATTRAGRWGLVAVLATGLVNIAQNLLDRPCTELAMRVHGVRDFAVHIHGLEGGLTAALQTFAPRWLTALMIYVYVCLYPGLYAGALLALHALGKGRLVRAGAAALVLNYVLALPFFLFVPVKETWYAQVDPAAGPKARLLLDDVSPALEPIFRTERGIENNFPSLHTSVAATAALLAWRSGRRRLGVLCTACAAVIAYSTLYLGFHWVTDMVAGCLHAAASVAIALRVVGEGAPARDVGRAPPLR